MTNLEQEAETARMMIEASGKRAYVLVVEVDGESAAMTRAVSSNTTKRDAVSIIGALNRERERVGRLIGLDPDSVVSETPGGA